MGGVSILLFFRGFFGIRMGMFSTLSDDFVKWNNLLNKDDEGDDDDDDAE